jgi:hypothetical protein
MGAVCLCIGECYARILDNIDSEAASLERSGEQKRVRISNCDDEVPHYASPPHDSSLFSVKLVPAEWRSIMRNVVKAEIFGETENKVVYFMKLVKLLEERQTRWHQNPPAPDCPPSYRTTCQLPDRVPTCLLIVNDVRKLVDSLAL